jgi:hypothetical protein
MAVMARAVGLPARLVTGYSTGTYDSPAARYLILEENAHSWVEIYFTGIGWVEFEPTAGRPVIDRPERSDRPALVLADLQPALPANPLAWLNPETARWIYGLGILAIGCGLAFITWSLVDTRRLNTSLPIKTLREIYHRLYRRARPLVRPHPAGDTPNEFSAHLTGRLASLARSKGRKAMLDQTARDIAQMTQLYNQAIYSPHPPGDSQRHWAVRTWLKLRRRLWQIRLIDQISQKSSKFVIIRPGKKSR